MARGRSRAERERLFAEGRCMATRCRQDVKIGDGSQFLEEDGIYSRFCARCAAARMQPDQAPDRGNADSTRQSA